ARGRRRQRPLLVPAGGPYVSRAHGGGGGDRRRPPGSVGWLSPVSGKSQGERVPRSAVEVCAPTVRTSLGYAPPETRERLLPLRDGARRRSGHAASLPAGRGRRPRDAAHGDAALRGPIHDSGEAADRSA